MRTFLAKCSAVALIAGGFALTGDAGRLLARGRGVIDATTIPQAAAPPAPAPPVASDAPAGAEAESAATPPVQPATAPASAASAPVSPPPPDAPIGSPAPRFVPGGAGQTSVNVTALSPGDRILVWIARGAARDTVAPLAFDVVDPATGDAIELRHASGDDRLSPLAPRRRVRLEGSVRQGLFAGSRSAPAGGRIDVQRALVLSSIDARGTARSATTSETIGPVVALRVVPAASAAP